MLDEVEALTAEFVREGQHLVNDDVPDAADNETLNQLESKSKALEEKFYPYLEQFEAMEKELKEVVERHS